MGIETAILGAAARAGGILKFGWRKLFPPKLGYPLAPSNLLEVITPFVYREKVLEVLGQPHSFYNNTAGYRFGNALLQVNYDNDTVESVVLVATRLWWPNRFRVFPLNLKIGASSFADACELAPDGTIKMQIDNSSKFYTRWKREYFGFGGRYMNYSFAMIEAATYPMVVMPKGDVDFGPEPEPEARRDTLRNPKQTRFNAVMVSRSENESFDFSWSIFS